MVEEVEQHRAAWLAVMEVLPDSVHLSHEVNLEADWDRPAIHMPMTTLVPPRGCKECGEPQGDRSLKEKCRDWHDICSCGARYDRAKGAGCLRQIWKVDELSLRIHPKPSPKEEK